MQFFVIENYMVRFKTKDEEGVVGYTLTYLYTRKSIDTGLATKKMKRKTQ
jgi:hypothetical protein